MSFIEVELSNWDKSKVSVGIAPKGKTPSVLYDGKIPILKLCSSDPKNKYVVFSHQGLKRNMKYDAATRKFLDIWEGDWSVSFCVATSVEEAEKANSHANKIMDIFADIEKKVETAFEGRKPNPSINYTYIKEKNQFGVDKIVGVDKSKGAYLRAKTGYDAPKDAKKITVDGKEVPVLEARYPKTKFYDITRSKNDMEIKNPDIECQTAMNAVPKIMIGLFSNSQGVFITRKLMQLYYEPTTIGGNAADDELIEMLRNGMDLNSDQ